MSALDDSTRARMQALFRLLTRPLPADDGDVGLNVLTEDSAGTRALAERERCLPNLLDLLAQRRALDDDERGTRERLRALHTSATTVCADLPEGTVLLKGANIHRLYPAGAARYSGDVDVMLRDYAALGALHSQLKQRGYTPAGSGWWGFVAEPQLRHGLASLRYEIPGQESLAVSVEVQIGGFPISVERAVGFDELCRDVRRLPERTYLTLAPTPQILLAIADFVGRTTPIYLRHLADLTLVVERADTGIDVDYLRARIRALDLRSGVDKLMEAARSKGLEAALPDALRALAQTSQRSAKAGMSDRTTTNPDRMESAGSDGLPLRRCGPLRRAAAAALLGSARLAYRLRPDARVTAALASRKGLVSFVLGAGYRVAGIPLSYTPLATTTVIDAGGGLYLCGGGGVVALSLWGDCTAGNRKWLFERLRAAPAPVQVSRL